MVREIKFRGLRKDGKGFVIGHYLKAINEKTGEIVHLICQLNSLVTESPLEVKEKTIGQFTGLKDKNGVDIYVGDIIECSGEMEYHTPVRGFDIPYVRRICFTTSGFTGHRILGKGGEFDDDNFSSSSIVSNYQLRNKSGSFKVIGNIHEREVKNG